MSKRKKTSNKRATPDLSGSAVASAPAIGLATGMAIIVLAVFFAYFPSINGGFIWDDKLLVTENKLIKAPDGLYRIWCTTEAVDYWPVTNTTFWIEWRLWETSPIGYHVANLILHIVESLLIWIILQKLAIPGAFWAALIFAVHPVNVESVAWIAQRKNTMAMLFFLLSILCYLEFLTRARVSLAAKQTMPYVRYQLHSLSCLILHFTSFYLWYWLSLALFILAMLSKGSVAVLPVILLVIIWWLRRLKWWDSINIAPFFLVAGALAAVNVWFQTHGTVQVFRDIGFTERLLGAGGAIWFYLYKAIIPLDLTFVYPQWHIEAGNILWWLPLMAALAATVILWWYRKSWSRPYLFAWLFFCMALVPVMGFTDIAFMQYSLVADRYQHIAIIGVIALLAAGWSAWHLRAPIAVQRTATAFVIAAVGSLIFLTWRQSELYRDSIALYEATLAKNPDCDMAQYNLANALRKTGKMPQAIEHYKKALMLRPDYLAAHFSLGDVLVQAGQPMAAIEHYQQFLRQKPDYPEVRNSLGIALSDLGRISAAIEQYEEALRLKPNLPETHYNLGNALIKTDRPQEAIEHYEQALRLKPDHLEAHINLGIAYAKTGRLGEAIELFQQALALNPDEPEAHKNLGNALIQTDRPQEAIEHFKQALRFRPDYIGAYNNLALAYARSNQTSEAVATAQKALDLARSQGNAELARQIEDWLNSYRAGIKN